MKQKIKPLVVLLLSIFITSACSSDNIEPDGKWGDIIKFSTTNVLLDKEPSTYSISSTGDWWWISRDATIDNKIIFFDAEFLEKEKLPIEFTLGRATWASDKVIYDKGADQEIKTINGEWFKIVKKTDKRLDIEVTKNTSGKPRNIRLSVQAGDYFTSISISQEG